MRGSFRFLKLAGVDIKLHFTFPLILVWGAVRWAEPHGTEGAVFGALLMAALFACVALHELGHALAARALGIPVREIVLLPIGGLAVLGRNPRRPLHELLIAAAGPLVNGVLAAVLFLALLAQGALPPDGRDLLAAGFAEPSLRTALLWLFGSNVMLVLFNLLPAFPMDGGRILRALLAIPLGYTRATRWAAGAGQLLAVAAGVYGLLSGQILLAVVALFVFLGATGERAAEEARGLLSTLRLRDAYNKHALTLEAGDRMTKVIDYLLTSYQPDFAVLHGGRLLGVVTRDMALRGLAAETQDVYVTGIMQREMLELDGELTLAEAQEALAEANASVAAVFEGDRFLGLVNEDDLREALQIAAFLQLAEKRWAPPLERNAA
ncbi:MAG TPA: M50 family metallopeptidase [Thermoanaerobaculia bacterium]|nr:M50 family metallopeptidase [Thermoanaerobaculia bacterium]